MSVEVNIEDGIICSVVIDGEEFDSEEDNLVVIPIPLLLKQDIKDFPVGLTIELCDSIQENTIMIHNVPTYCTLVSENKFQIIVEETIARKYWDAPIGLKLWMETKRDIVNDRNNNFGNVKIENYKDDGAYISLSYSFDCTPESFNELIYAIDQIYADVEGATDIALGSPFEKIENCNKERDFTMKVLLPIFRNLGFSNVKYNHGTKEYGKDITFARRTEFDEYEYYGVQVKFGDVSGGANGDINELISQAIDAFQMPFYDVYSHKKVRISKLIIAISGKFTQNAIEKIVDGVNDYPLKNNIIFIDGEKIKTLIERYRRF